jgi:hypothetical protein
MSDADFDAADYLDNDEVIAEYLMVAASDSNPDVFLAALTDVSKAFRSAKFAKGGPQRLYDRGHIGRRYAAFFSKSAFHWPRLARPFMRARWEKARWAAATFSVRPAHAFCGAACKARP